MVVFFRAVLIFFSMLLWFFTPYDPAPPSICRSLNTGFMIFSTHIITYKSQQMCAVVTYRHIGATGTLLIFLNGIISYTLFCFSLQNT